MQRYNPFQDETPFDVCGPCSEVKQKAEMQRQSEAAQLAYGKSKDAQIFQRLRDCNIGDRFKGMTFPDYKPTCDKAAKIHAECQKYVDCFKDSSGCNILMIGSPGTGKNMIAAIIGQEVIKRDFSFLHTTAMKLVRRIKDSWRNKEESEQEVINSFVSPSLLVIDEIGVQFGSPTEQLFLTEVINERYEKRRPTILISNLKLSQLKEVMGERVIDRFYDDGSKLLIFDWQSYRKQHSAILMAA